jgi:hypothetical protein
MPKPRTGKTNTGSGSQSSNPIKALLNQIKEKKRQRQEMAAREVSDDMVKNGQTIIRILGQIDFDHSGLPKEILEKKSSELQPCGDIECTVMIIEQELMNAPSFITDLRELDERLIKIAYHFSEAVEKGNVEQARYSRIALLRGIKKIRKDVPDTQTERTEQYIKAMATYLDDWLILIEESMALDAKTGKIDELISALQADKDKQQEQEDEFQQMLRDPSTGSYALAEEMRNMDSTEGRNNWTKEMRDLHKKMIDLEVRRHTIRFNDTQIEHLESECRQLRGHLQMMEANVAGVPHVTDPNLMDRYFEAINRTMQEMFASDARVDEMMRASEEQEGVLDQLDNAPGAVREFDHAVNEVNRQMKQLEENQTRLKNEQDESARLLQERGILSNEEMEEERQRQEEELASYQREYEENEEVLYN